MPLICPWNNYFIRFKTFDLFSADILLMSGLKNCSSLLQRVAQYSIIEVPSIHHCACSNEELFLQKPPDLEKCVEIFPVL